MQKKAPATTRQPTKIREWVTFCLCLLLVVEFPASRPEGDSGNSSISRYYDPLDRTSLSGGIPVVDPDDHSSTDAHMLVRVVIDRTSHISILSRIGYLPIMTSSRMVAVGSGVT